MIHIEAGILPPTDRTRYPFRDMEPGDSILFEEKAKALSARVSAIRFARLHTKGWVFSMRRVDAGWRLWRMS